MRQKVNTSSKQRIQDIINRIIEAVHPVAIYLFGSAARNTMDEESDLDILVVAEVPEEKTRWEISGDIRALFRGWGIPMDIIVIPPDEFQHGLALPGHVARIAVMEGECLYGEPAVL